MGDELATVFSGFRAKVEDPVGGFDDVKVVLDHQQRVAGIHESLEDGEEILDIREMEPGGGLVEDEELAGGGRPSAGGEELAELEALGLATGEGVEGLAELEIAEADFCQGGEEFDDLLVALEPCGRDTNI